MASTLRVRLRRALFLFHFWVGLTLGLYFAMLGLTGSVLVFRNELEEWSVPELGRVHHAPSEPLAPVSRILAQAHKTFPTASDAELSGLMFPRHPGAAYSLVIKGKDGREYATFDPVTTELIHRGSYDGHWIVWVGDLHMYLLMEAKGMLLNTYGGILVTLLLASGVWLVWPAARSQWRARLNVKRGASLKRRLNDLHNVFGLYGLLFLMMVATTGAVFGVWETVEQAVYAVTRTPKESATPPVRRIDSPRLSLDEVVRIAEATVPEARIGSVSYPKEAGKPVSVWKVLNQDQFLYVSLQIDPSDGRVLKVVDSRTQPAGGQIMRWIQMLHFGWWGSWFSRILYALLGLLPLGLYVTGAGRYVLRRRPAKK